MVDGGRMAWGAPGPMGDAGSRRWGNCDDGDPREGSDSRRGEGGRWEGEEEARLALWAVGCGGKQGKARQVINYSLSTWAPMGWRGVGGEKCEGEGEGEVRLSRKALPDCQRRHAIVARETAASHVARLIKGLDQGLCRSIDQANPGGGPQVGRVC